MRQILYMVLALFAMLATSCSNDDIVIEKTGKLYSLTLNINTQGLYDEFNFTSDALDLIRDKDMAIAVKTFVYDSDGNLVSSEESREYTLSPVGQTFDSLTEGIYTVITVQSIVTTKFEDTDAPWYPWNFSDSDKLSTLQIRQLRNEISFYNALGVASETVSIQDNKIVNSQPKALGSLVELYFLNFDESSYVSVGFGTDDVISGYRLDPSVPQSDRYLYESTASSNFRLRGGTLIDGNSVRHITRYILDKSIDYSFCFTKTQEDYDKGSYNYWPANNGSANLSDGKTYYGGAYFISDSKKLECYFGDKAGFDKWSEDVIKQNTPTEILPNLYMTWGGSVSNVQAAMSGYTQTVGSYGSADLQDDGTYALAFEGKGIVSNIIYAFTSATTGLFEIDVQYQKTSVSSEEILNYMNANYIYAVDQNGIYMYYSNDYSTIVMFFEIGGVYNIGFVDANYLNSLGAKKNMPHFDDNIVNDILRSQAGSLKSVPSKSNVMKALKAERETPELFNDYRLEFK